MHLHAAFASCVCGAGPVPYALARGHCLCPSQVCPYDASHDGPIEELPDDVCDMAGFGEAGLLTLLRRRLVEKLAIYTYVGDIVVSVNPHMRLLEMVAIAEYPRQKAYEAGKDASVYATAQFAYWRQRDAQNKPRNQSVIALGESGAGKTVQFDICHVAWHTRHFANAFTPTRAQWWVVW